jgi:hypothetical protein
MVSTPLPFIIILLKDERTVFPAGKKNRPFVVSGQSRNTIMPMRSAERLVFSFLNQDWSYFTQLGASDIVLSDSSAQAGIFDLPKNRIMNIDTMNATSLYKYTKGT